MWIFMFFFATGVITTDIKSYQIEFNNREACINFMSHKKPKKKPDNQAMMCVSKDTGEVVHGWE